MLRSRKRTLITARDYENKLLGGDTPFAITEAFKMLRTNILYLAKGDKCPSFAVTSSHAHAGKSIIVANIAASFAQLGKKVLLIDADMRCPVQHKIFGTENSRGLSELLAAVDGADGSSVLSHAVSGVDLIVSGRIPPNPSELLSSDRMRAFLAGAKEKYDYIFIDTPPICEVSDAGALADCISGYLLAVRSAATDQREIDAAIGTLQGMNADIAGIVLNDVDPKRGGYGGKNYGKYSKYGYYRSYYGASKK